jgi:DNA-directed RNA polymerase sigma subunit (sigma70/sigma32)
MKIRAEVVKEAYIKLGSKLTVKEADIITRYYGITPNVRHTLAELGAIHGVTRERIRQIKVEALKKLRVK